MRKENITIQHVVKEHKDWRNLLKQLPSRYQAITAAVDITSKGTAIWLKGLHEPSYVKVCHLRKIAEKNLLRQPKPKQQGSKPLQVKTRNKKLEDSDYIQIEAGTSDCKVHHDEDLKVLKQILTTLVQRVIDKGQDITIVFKVPGLDISSNDQYAQKIGLSSKPGHIYCANANSGKGLDWDALGFIDDIIEGKDISLKLQYMNEPELPRGEGNSNMKVLILNDAAIVATSAKGYLEKNRMAPESNGAALALVCDEGINLSVYRTGDQEYPMNEEIGQELLPKPKADEDIFKFQSPLDLIYARTKEGSKDLTIEETFAGGALSRAYKMLIKMLQTPNILESMKIPVLDHLNQFIPKGCRLDIRNIDGSNQLVVINRGPHSTEEVTLIQLDNNIDNDKILAKVKEWSPLEQALLVSLAKRLGNTIVKKFEGLLISHQTQVFAWASSPLLDGISKLSRARNALFGTIQDFRTKQHTSNLSKLGKLQLLKRNSTSMNGLLHVLRDEIAGI